MNPASRLQAETIKLSLFNTVAKLLCNRLNFTYLGAILSLRHINKSILVCILELKGPYLTLVPSF